MNGMHKLDVFQTNCLWRICNIFWKNTISIEFLYRRTNSLPISCQIKKQRMRWLDNILRMPHDHIPRVALSWTPTVKRSKGCRKTRWRRSIIAELSDMGLMTLGEAQVIVQETDLPACGSPASFSLHLASSVVTPAESTNIRGDNVVRMWVQFKR